MAWNRSQIHKYPNHTKTSVLRIENILKRSQIGFSKSNSETTPRELVAVVVYVTVACCKSVMITLEEPIRGSHSLLLRNCLQWPHKRDFLDKPDSEAKTQIVSHVVQQQMLQEISLQPDGMCHALKIGKIEPLSSDSVFGVVFCTVCIAKS